MSSNCSGDSIATRTDAQSNSDNSSIESKRSSSICTETTPLLFQKENLQHREEQGFSSGDEPRSRKNKALRIIGMVGMVLLLCMALLLLTTTTTSFTAAIMSKINNDKKHETKKVGRIITDSSFTIRLAAREEEEVTGSFPDDFVWGVATSSYQIEGAVQEDGRGPTIWDTFVHDENPKQHILDHSTGDVADDHYHRWKDDVELMKSLGIRAYRFSIAWSRILPTGQHPINPAGIQFYQNLVNELLRNNIEPWITLFHWDLPQALQDEYGGWLSMQTVDAFVEYATVIFENFPQVKRFITLNEPWTYSVNGHGSGIHAPGRNSNPTTEPYLVAHHLLLAHARTAKLYRQEFGGDDGMIGIANCGDYRYPGDHEAAERAMLFQWGWFVEPLVFGRYPEVMRERLGDRLPEFSSAEQEELRSSYDFLGLNYYSAFIASTPNNEAAYGGFWADIHVDFSNDPSWDHNDMGWNVVPEGLTAMLRWIAERYDNPLIYITENGTAEPEMNPEQARHDEKRRYFIENHLRASKQAIQDGVNVAGYFAWSLMDNFEWQFGYQRRFGICRVDYDSLQRTPKGSALWYRDTIKSQGQNVGKSASSTPKESHRSLMDIPRARSLPSTVLMGYASNVDAVGQAVRDGVNIITWAFVDVRSVPYEGPASVEDRRLSSSAKTSEQQYEIALTTGLNMTAIRNLKEELVIDGYDHVLHFAGVGGWSGLHLDPRVSAQEWYTVFKNSAGDVFDGIDWDLEGTDQMDSPRNFFTLDCLDKMGEISRLAKEDGRFVTMAPAQSYLDIQNPRFSRFVNLTEDRGWHDDFSYFGANVYAYVLQKYNQWIDLVSVQFYESFSRAGMAIHDDGMRPSEYLVWFVQTLVLNREKVYVNFANDPETGLGGQYVVLPLQKLVFGLANGWVHSMSDPEKSLYIPPSEIEIAWKQLVRSNHLPRGCMFWTIDEEGSHGIYLARDLKRILEGDDNL